MEAIKTKNQSKVNKAVNALIKYNELNRKRDIADGEGNEKEVNKLNRLCENSFDKFETYLAELPKYEQKQILKSELY